MKFWKKRKAVSQYEFEGHRVSGRFFRVFSNTLNIPMTRRMAYYSALHNVTLRLRGADLDVAIEMMREKLNQQDWTGVAFLLETMASYRSLYTQRAVIYELANPIIVMDDEPVEELVPEISREKRKLCEEDEDVAALFFTCGMDSIAKTSETSSDINPGDFLKSPEVRAIESRFLQSIGRNIWGGNLYG